MMKWLMTATFIVLLSVPVLSQDSVIVEITRAAMCDLCMPTVWLDTLPRRPFLAGGQWSSAKWTLPAGRYDVRTMITTKTESEK